MAGGQPGDLALAMLAGGGQKHILEIAKRAGGLRGIRDDRAKMMRGRLTKKFGKLPKWIDERLEEATCVQIERWSKKTLTADTLEGVLGKK